MRATLRAAGKLFIAGAAAVCLAACSSAPAANQQSTQTPSGTTSPAPRTASPSPAPSPQPPVVTGTAAGQATPAEAVAGFLDTTNVDSVEIGNNFATACAYVVPADQAACPGFLAQATLTADPPVYIGQVSISGSQAIVVVVGHVCADFTCFGNSDAAHGIPTSTAGFANAYQEAINGIGNGYTAYPCTLVGNSWYVNFG